ncbi:MAG: HAD-IA family hydrolase [Myxococcota bacterium]
MQTTIAQPRAFLLDAGNTVVFLDREVVAATLRDQGHRHVSASAVAQALRPATARYAARLRDGAAHEDGWRAFMATLVREVSVPHEDVERSVDALRREHDRFNLWRHVPKHVRAALHRFRATGRPVAIVSNSEGHLDRLFARTELTDMFDVVIDSANEGVRKPDPELFRRALARLGLSAPGCLYAGDIPDVDVVGARAAGLQPILIDALDQHPSFTAAPRLPSLAHLADAIGLPPASG